MHYCQGCHPKIAEVLLEKVRSKPFFITVTPSVAKICRSHMNGWRILFKPCFSTIGTVAAMRCITLSEDRYLGWMFPKVNRTIANLCFLTCVPRGLQSSSSSKKAIIWTADGSLEKRGWVWNTLPSHTSSIIPSLWTRDWHCSTWSIMLGSERSERREDRRGTYWYVSCFSTSHLFGPVKTDSW